jgi:hypothetical protein
MIISRGREGIRCRELECAKRRGQRRFCWITSNDEEPGGGVRAPLTVDTSEFINITLFLNMTKLKEFIEYYCRRQGTKSREPFSLHIAVINASNSQTDGRCRQIRQTLWRYQAGIAISHRATVVSWSITNRLNFGNAMGFRGVALNSGRLSDEGPNLCPENELHSFHSGQLGLQNLAVVWHRNCAIAIVVAIIWPFGPRNHAWSFAHRLKQYHIS